MEKKLKNEINELITLYKNTSSQRNRMYLYSSIMYLKEIYHDLTKKTILFKPKYEDISFRSILDQEENKSIYLELVTDENRKMVNTFTENGIAIIKENSDLKECFFESTITFDTAKEIIYSFFEKFDKSTLPFIKQMLENNIVFCNPKTDNLGYTNNIRTLKKSYIVLFANKDDINIEILITIIHELGHVMYNKMMNNKLFYDSFLEVFSYFLEQTFIEYCIKNDIHSIDCLKSQKNDICNLYDWLDDLRTINTFFDKVDVETLSLKLKRKDLKTIGLKDRILKFKECDSFYLRCYGVSLGFYYAKLYENDPEKTNLYVEAFLKDIGVYRDTYMLSHYGIDNEQFLSCEYLKPFLERQKILNKNTQI